MGRREENDGSRGRKSVSVESEEGVEETTGRLRGGGADGERRQGMIPEGSYRCSKISPHHSTNEDAA